MHIEFGDDITEAVICEPQRTPGLDVQYDYRLCGNFGLGCLLLVVLSQTLLTDLHGPSIFLFVAAKQVDIIFLLLSSRGSGGEIIRTVGGIRLGRIAGKGCEFVVVTSNVFVPTRSVRVLGSLGLGSAQGLEDGHIGLGRREAMDTMSQWSGASGGNDIEAQGKGLVQKCNQMLVESSFAGLEAGRKHGPICWA